MQKPMPGTACNLIVIDGKVHFATIALEAEVSLYSSVAYYMLLSSSLCAIV